VVARQPFAIAVATFGAVVGAVAIAIAPMFP
jgi:hypothetical protein